MVKIVRSGNSFLAAMIVMLSANLVLAQGTPKLDIHIAEAKINLTVAEQREGAAIVYSPGDTVRYLITASNTGTGLMTSPEIVDPIPAGVTYIPESASGADTNISFSINQGSTYMAWPPEYTVRNSRGILVKKKATPEMITHVKWEILKNLSPGESVILDFLVVVNN